MEKRQRGEEVDGDPCPEKHGSEEEGKCKKGGNSKGEIRTRVIPKDKVYKGGFGVPKNNIRAPQSRGGGPLGFRAIRNFYDSSETLLRISRIRMDELFYITQLAMWTYNFKEDTKFDNVNVLRGNRFIGSDAYYYITFQAFSPQGVATTFQTKICKYFPSPCWKIEFVFVRIIPDDSDFDDFSDNSKKYSPSVGHPKNSFYRGRLYQLFETNDKDPQLKLPVYLSQFALINYHIIDLHVHAARHDISSLNVKPMERVSKQTTYLLTFQASLCADSSNKVETFETEIYIPNFFPTTTIEFWDFTVKTN